MALAPAVGAQPAAAPAANGSLPSGGAGTIYVGTYAKRILVVDEGNLKVTDTIPLTAGIPYGMQLSFNRQKLYVLEPSKEQVEIVDLASRRPVDKFTLSSKNTAVRIWGMSIDPRERFAVLLVKQYAKKLDRYEISRPVLLRYDLAKKQVTDTIAWPKGEERDGAQIIFSPNGDLLYFFTTDDVLIYDTQTLKQVDRWELSRTLFEEGMGRLNFGFANDIYEEPGFYTGLFRVTDPVNRRTLMGVARVDLVNRTMDYFSLGPSGPASFRLAPGRRRAYGIQQAVGNYMFWTYDLENRQVLNRVEFRGRPRMGLTVSSNGSLLYIHTAGSTIDLYDTQSFAHRGTVDLRADMTGFVLVPPRQTPPAR